MVNMCSIQILKKTCISNVVERSSVSYLISKSICVFWTFSIVFALGSIFHSLHIFVNNSSNCDDWYEIVENTVKERKFLWKVCWAVESVRSIGNRAGHNSSCTIWYARKLEFIRVVRRPTFAVCLEELIL